MNQNESRRAGRHFLQIPGPTSVPDRVLRAMDTPVIDHRGPEFARLTRRAIEGLQSIFKTKNPVIIYTATGTGAWEAALVNTLSPGDKVLFIETGQFAALWRQLATKLGLVSQTIKTDWRTGANPAEVEATLLQDKQHDIKAVCLLHNETSTGTLSPVQEVRKAMDVARHPALLIVDTISSLASTDYRHDEWGVDVSVGGSQKGLMLPPGMSFNAVSTKALRQHESLAEATRTAVRGWGLEIVCRSPDHYSPTITAVLLPDHHDSDMFRRRALEEFDISFGASFGPFTGKVFRIGNLGDKNKLTILAALAGAEMALSLAGVPHQTGGVQKAMTYMVSERQAA